MMSRPATSTKSASASSAPIKMNGARFERAARENTALRSERDAVVQVGAIARVLDSFVFMFQGKPVSLSEERLTAQDWSGISAVGAVASLIGAGGLFAQCGWFHRVHWLWIFLPRIEEIRVKENHLYWNGEPRLWLKTPLGEYAILTPHTRYAKQWSVSMLNMGDTAQSCAFRRWPIDGPRPFWWPADAYDKWISPTTVPSKRAGTSPLDQLGDLCVAEYKKRKRLEEEAEVSRDARPLVSKAMSARPERSPQPVT